MSKFEIPNDDNKSEQENNIEKIEDTKTFSEAVANGNLEEAEKWLLDNKERYDARWLDHRSYELFKAYRNNGDYQAAKRMVELANGENAIAGRKAVLEKESGIPYDEI